MNKLPVIVKAFLLFIVVWGLLVGITWTNLHVVNWLHSQGVSSEDAFLWMVLIVFLAFCVASLYISYKDSVK